MKLIKFNKQFIQINQDQWNFMKFNEKCLKINTQLYKLIKFNEQFIKIIENQWNFTKSNEKLMKIHKKI